MHPCLFPRPRRRRAGLAPAWGGLLALGLMPLSFAAEAGASAAGTTDPEVPAAVAAPAAEPLQPLDRVEFWVAEDPFKATATAIVQVTAQGELEVPVAGGSDVTLRVNVTDKTYAEVKQELKAKLDARYYLDATVHLRVVDPARKTGQVLFYGAVRNHSLLLPREQPRSLLEGILYVGHTEFANLRKVKLSRFDAATKSTVVTVVDVEAIKKDPTKDVMLQDGDRVEVPTRRFVL